MAMNFYKEQAHARRQAKIMIALFLLFTFFLIGVIISYIFISSLTLVYLEYILVNSIK